MWDGFVPNMVVLSFSHVLNTGMDDGNNLFTSIKEALKDVKKIKYHQGYLTSLNEAIK